MAENNNKKQEDKDADLIKKVIGIVITVVIIVQVGLMVKNLVTNYDKPMPRPGNPSAAEMQCYNAIDEVIKTENEISALNTKYASLAEKLGSKNLSNNIIYKSSLELSSHYKNVLEPVITTTKNSKIKADKVQMCADKMKDFSTRQHFLVTLISRANKTMEDILKDKNNFLKQYNCNNKELCDTVISAYVTEKLLTNKNLTSDTFLAQQKLYSVLTDSSVNDSLAANQCATLAVENINLSAKDEVLAKKFNELYLNKNLIGDNLSNTLNDLNVYNKIDKTYSDNFNKLISNKFVNPKYEAICVNFLTVSNKILLNDINLLEKSITNAPKFKADVDQILKEKKCANINSPTPECIGATGKIMIKIGELSNNSTSNDSLYEQIIKMSK